MQRLVHGPALPVTVEAEHHCYCWWLCGLHGARLGEVARSDGGGVQGSAGGSWCVLLVFHNYLVDNTATRQTVGDLWLCIVAGDHQL